MSVLLRHERTERYGETGVNQLHRKLADIALVGEDEGEHGVALADMVDVNRLYIATHRAGNGADLRDDAGAIHHGDAHLQKLLGGGHPGGGQRPAGIGGLGEQARERLAVAGFQRGGEGAQDAGHLVEAAF